MSAPRRISARLRRGWLPAALAIMAAPCQAGSFIFAGEDNGVGIIAHPSGYTGAGGVVTVEVCIDASAPDAATLEVPVQNVLKTWNSLTAQSPNLVFGNGNDIPRNSVDFESLTLHEIGHCIGLGHPNLASESGLAGDEREFTRSTNGNDGNPDAYDVDAGDDGVPGSSDDSRGDDENLHWFAAGVNNPFVDVPAPDASNFSRDLADLPPGDGFAANASRQVAALLGYGNTEAVMQQGQFYDEDQRSLQADDVATLRFAMTGLDETAGTADDYTIDLVYGGIQADTSGCDIVIEPDPNAFGACGVRGQFLSANHIRITSATYYYGTSVNFHFNQVPLCSATNEDLVFTNVTVTDAQSHEACATITYGSGFVVAPGGSVVATAPSVTFAAGTTIGGEFRVRSLVP